MLIKVQILVFRDKYNPVTSSLDLQEYGVVCPPFTHLYSIINFGDGFRMVRGRK